MEVAGTEQCTCVLLVVLYGITKIMSIIFLSKVDLSYNVGLQFSAQPDHSFKLPKVS